MSRRVLIVASTTGYQTRLFEETARRIGITPVLATDRCHRLEDPWGDDATAIRFEAPDEAARTLSEGAAPPDGIIAVGDNALETAAATAERLGIPWHPREAVKAGRSKFEARERFRTAGLPTPEYSLFPVHLDAGEAVRAVQFPCVLKPTRLSASRGVIRANNEAEFLDAFARIRGIVDEPEVRRLHGDEIGFVLAEDYIPGREFALEGLLIGGRLKTLAIFDKPDPLEGPYFEETIYITPSREPEAVQEAIRSTVARAAEALGLCHGPIHAEVRVNDRGVWMLEAAARPIGGLCAQSLRFEGGMGLEELLLRFAAGEDVSDVEHEGEASGVMMIPVPASGVYAGVSGLEEAQQTPGITAVLITAKEGQRLQRFPEGSSYPGFLFARGRTPQEVEAALRASHACLRFDIRAELPALRPEN